MTDLAQAEAILAELVAFPSVSRDPNREITDWIAERLRAVGARIEIMPDASGDKANLWATLGPEGDGGLVLSAHTDVVPIDGQDWSVPPFTLTAKDGRYYGRGTCDMKGFLACVLAHAPAYAALRLSRPIHFAFTHDEEIGCLGAQRLTQALAYRGARPAMVLVGEPTGMRLVDGHKGCCEYTTRFTGLEGHGSNPGAGVNAVEYAVRYARKLLELADELKARAPADSPFDPAWTSLNIGRLSGGAAHNVIPGEAEIDWEMRPVAAEDHAYAHDALHRFTEETLLPAMRAVSPAAGVETRVIGEVAGLVPRKDNAARDLLARLTGANGRQCVAFGTEAGLFQSLGSDVIVCGPGEIAQAHKPDEFVTRDQLAACLAMLGRLGQTLAA
jgi:acetylornithine deacetylase